MTLNGNNLKQEPIQIGTDILNPSSSVRCLGVVWSDSLSPKGSITKSIRKARRAFFACGISKRKLNPCHSLPVKSLRYVLFLSVSMDVKTGYSLSSFFNVTA